MFLESGELKHRIQEVAEEIANKTDGHVLFEEYIALPFYGQIILRFNLTEAVESLDQLDAYETLLYEVVQDEFLIDFMGNVYQDAGVDYRNFEALLRRAYEKYKQEPVYESRYGAAVREDAEYLLALCGLDRNRKVWEIQLEEETLLLLMGQKAKAPEKYAVGDRTIVVMETEEICCEGLMKAAFCAKRTHQSLARMEIDL